MNAYASYAFAMLWQNASSELNLNSSVSEEAKPLVMVQALFCLHCLHMVKIVLRVCLSFFNAESDL